MTVMYFGKSDPTMGHAPAVAVAVADRAAFDCDELIEFSGIPADNWEFLSA